MSTRPLRRSNPQSTAAPGDGFLGFAAIQYCGGPGAAVDRGGGSQRNFFHFSLWALSAVGFFVPTALVIVELTSRDFRKKADVRVVERSVRRFSRIHRGLDVLDLHGFLFSGFAAGERGDERVRDWTARRGFGAESRFLLAGSFVLLVVAVGLNMIGLNIGKWLQNAGGVSTYLPLLILTVVAVILWRAHGAVTHFTWPNMMPTWDWGTVNFWPQIAFAFTGLEIASMMSEEVRDPRRVFPRAIFASGALIAVIYIVGTFAVLSLVPAEQVDPKSGVFQAITMGSTMLRVGFLGVLAAMLVSVGNAGGVGSDGGGSLAGAVRGGDRPLFAGGVWQDSSALEDAVRGDFGAGGNFCGYSAVESNQRDGK